MPFPPPPPVANPPDGPIPLPPAALTTIIPAPTPTSLTMLDLKNILLPAEQNIMQFIPPPPPPPPGAPPPIPDPLPEQIAAYAAKTADQLSKALFPYMQILIVQLANQIIDERISSQLAQLQTDVDAIKSNLGI